MEKKLSATNLVRYIQRGTDIVGLQFTDGLQLVVYW